MEDPIQSLYEKGFNFIEGIQYSPKLLNYLTKRESYEIGNRLDKASIEIPILSPEMTQELYEGFPETLKKSLAIFKLRCCVNMCEVGFTLPPHRDYYDLAEGSLSSTIATLVLWITPYVFTGREFVYGRMTDVNYSDRSVFGWDDKRLEVLGEAKPETGKGVLVDLFNPIWWHGVRPLLTGGPVISLGVNIL